MSAFLNTMHEEGSLDDIKDWIIRIAAEKQTSPRLVDGSRLALLAELKRLYILKPTPPPPPPRPEPSKPFRKT